ncbi:MAG: hypothetical protein KKG75_05720 [Nanoarchaeota archaeon]|nr:hypothetical protein [Nanoarchaeota archaeon]
MKRIIFAVLLTILILPIANAQQAIDDPGVTPDSFLWGLDKALDQLSLLLTTGDADKAKKGLEIAEERLAEIKTMIEENKLEAANKAKEEHGKNLLKVKENIKIIEKDNSLEEIKDVVEIERELEEHDEKVEETFGELKVKIKVEGEFTQQQKDLIDSILSSLQGQTGEVEIEIKNKKNKIKIEIEQKTGKSEDEIEIEIEDIEKEKGIKKQEKASEEIKEAKEEFNEFLKESEEKNITISQDLINQFNLLLGQATNEFEQSNFIEARKLAKQAEKLLDEREENQEGENEKEIEIEIEEGKSKVKVKIGKEKLKFELNTIDLDVIINEISSRTGLSKEEINRIMEVKFEEEEELEETEKEDNEDKLEKQEESGEDESDSEDNDKSGDNEESDKNKELNNGNGKSEKSDSSGSSSGDGDKSDDEED